MSYLATYRNEYLMDFAALASECAPAVDPGTLEAVVRHESGFNPVSVNVNRARLSRTPSSLAEAVDVARRAIGMGLSVDMGLGQINSRNLAALGLTVEQVFEPCRNLWAAQTILVGCYLRAGRRLDAALSCYNAGDFRRGVSNGYVSAVYRAARR